MKGSRYLCMQIGRECTRIPCAALLWLFMHLDLWRDILLD